MCNFYSRHKDPRRLVVTLEVDEPELPNMEPRYVIRPTDVERVVAVGKDGKRHLVPMRWDLVPPTTEDIKKKPLLTNARAETILQKGIFSAPLRKGRRCLVPLDGFFEFSGAKGNKQPHYIKARDDRLMAFAGLWDMWKGPKDAPLPEPLLSYTFATCEPNAVVALIHNRMPVLLTDKQQWNLWLSSEATEGALTGLLKPAPDDLLVAFKVTRELLKVKEPGPDVLEPAA